MIPAQRRAISGQRQFQIAELPLIDVSITFDRSDVIGFALQSAFLSLADKIISQNAIEFFLVGVEIRDRPFVFDIFQLRQHLVVIRWRRRVDVFSSRWCSRYSPARRSVRIFCAAVRVAARPVHASVARHRGASITAAIQIAKIPRINAPAIPTIHGHARRRASAFAARRNIRTRRLISHRIPIVFFMCCAA